MHFLLCNTKRGNTKANILSSHTSRRFNIFFPLVTNSYHWYKIEPVLTDKKDETVIP